MTSPDRDLVQPKARARRTSFRRDDTTLPDPRRALQAAAEDRFLPPRPCVDCGCARSRVEGTFGPANRCVRCDKRARRS